MPIDFFIPHCGKIGGNCSIVGIVCYSTTEIKRFGIKDADANSRKPAYYIENEEENWDVIVSNPELKTVVFKAVDYCIDIFRTGTYDLNDDNRIKVHFTSDNVPDERRELIKRCEGFLFFDNKVLFIELKNRKTGNWLKDAREKFEETLLSFLEHNREIEYVILKPIVSNVLHIGPHQNEMVQKRILKDKTGFDFLLKKKITIGL